ncbi:MAG: hypothetical protein SFV54_04695 [Bryobacteraceae bacterium]|nr:hypothetical protein [Bryobacteraceae bacterium]
MSAGLLQGEFLLIEQKFGGLDCPSCSDSLERAFKRVRGVESVEVGEGVVRLRLTAGNAVRLERIHDALKGAGYTPGDAAVTVAGKSNGAEFEVSGFEPAYRLRFEGRAVEGQVRGVVPAPKPASPLLLRALD